MVKNFFNKLINNNAGDQTQVLELETVVNSNCICSCDPKTEYAG